MQTKTNAKERYDLLPEAIRDWLGSFEATNHITNINDSYKVSWEKRRVIPRNIARLAIGMVKPEAFQSTIKAELGVSDPIAAQITTKIAQKILVPVADALKTTQNIDLSPLMKMAATKPQTGQSQLRPISLDSLAKQGQTLSSASQTEESTTKKPMSAFASIKQGSLAHESQKQQAEQKSAPQTDTVQEVPELDQPENFQPIDSNKPEAKPSSKQQVQQADRPFMLHEETPKSPSNQQSISASDFSFELPGEGRPAQEPRQEKTKVSFGNFFNRVAKEKQAEQPQKVESKKEAPKVVHYSAFRTMLGDQDPKK